MVSNKCNTKQETDTMQITNEQYLELSAEIAGVWLEDAYLGDIWQKDDSGDERYTDDAQDRFNDILDTVQCVLDVFVEKI